MDISKEYIEMCGKAVEIQELIEKPTTGKYVYDGKFCVDENDRLWLADDKVCLLRQDQSQDMLPDEPNHFPSLTWIEKFAEFYKLNYQKRWTMEQLWLAFVMNERFNKVWDGENWV